jgi:hypothetical protein
VQAALLAAFAPWVPIAVYQMRFHQMDWVAPATLTKVAGTLLLLLLGETGVQALGVAAWIALIAPGLFLAWALGRARRWRQLCRYGFALAWFGVPFATIAILARIYPIFQSKQTLMLLTPLALVVAAGLASLPRLPRWVLICALAAFVALSIGAMVRVETKDGWDDAAAFVQERFRAGDVLYLNPAAGMLTLQTYLARPLAHAGYPLGYDIRTGGWESERVTPSVAAQAMGDLSSAGYRRVWLIEFVPEFWDPEGYLPGWLAEHGQAGVERSFGRIRIRLYELAHESSRYGSQERGWGA